MNITPPIGARARKLPPVSRRVTTISDDDLVRRVSPPGAAMPTVFQPLRDQVDLVEWAKAHRALIDACLLESGAILFRGFGVRTPDGFQRFTTATSGELLPYVYRSTPRTQVHGHVYTATEYPRDETIPLHNENSYAHAWPLRIAFCCVTAAATGGETPIASVRAVTSRLDPAIKERFSRLKLMYVRNYGRQLDLPWQDVFQTTSRAEVERYCAEFGIRCTWTGEDRLRTAQVCEATATHPVTREVLWFNQAHLFHVSSLTAAVRESLLALFDERDQPRNV
jgi:alpha-ketoglutarate-dependent taurine dioxygenase